MRSGYVSTLACAAVVALTGCGDAGGGNGLLETDEQKASYGIGRDVGRNLSQVGENLDMDAFMRGVREELAGEDPALPQEEIRAALQRYMEGVRQAQQQQAEENLTAGQEFLAENASREGVQTTESGLQYEVLEEGSGPQPGPQDSATVHYEGQLLDGTVFDTSRDEAGEPVTFRVGGVIQGFAEGLQLMHEGATYRFWIPSELAYGPQGTPGGPIGPNQTLIFEVEMLDVHDVQAGSGQDAGGGQGGGAGGTGAGGGGGGAR